MTLALAPSSGGQEGRRRYAGDPPSRRVEVGPTGLDIDDCESLLADVGFLLVPGAPTPGGNAYLLVALRPKPTRAHFDPERIELWMRANGRSEPAEVSFGERPEARASDGGPSA